MKRLFIVLTLIALGASVSPAQKSAPKPNAEIQKMMREISARRIETDIRKLASFGTRNTNSEQDNPTRGIGAARDWIFAEFQKISADCSNCLTVEKQTYLQPKANRVPDPVNITNVFATLRGTTDPDRIYVVSGHYDSMCSDPADGKCDAPGANDDASGTAAVIELARVMSKRKFEATIIFMAVAGEEQGLLGARHFAEQAAEKKWNIEAMFTNDIIGGVTTQKNSPNRNRVRVFSEGIPSDKTETEEKRQATVNGIASLGGENDFPSRQLARYIKEQSDRYLKNFSVWMIYRRDRYLRGGDHIPFLEKGFSAVRITESDEDYTHQHQNVRTENGVFYGDTPEFVDFEYVANVTRVNMIALASLALAPAKPKNVGIVTARLTNDTDLKWNANTDADLAGYEIVWRETTAPEWTNSVFVAASQTTHTAKAMSKDNYFFGVRAVDRDGNKSPVVYPRPMR
jgi:Zn-dependent M28 family amino/carboxypeptidase